MPDIGPAYLSDVLIKEQQRIVEKMNLPPGTARNRALYDNIFVLLACIINRIPLFLCGKPGCSKTSAIQIVLSNLKGRKSNVEHFRIFPELVPVSFQGSQNCTSESITKVFERAADYTQVKSSEELIPVIVFDEIGLAELSPHNPLKVLHGELEIENCQYGFVGVSNWRLDASKMNRALYLAISDPDVNDLQITAETICESMSTEEYSIQLNKSVLEGLAYAYYSLREFMKKTHHEAENYFGLRDYYSLIKGIVHDFRHFGADSDIYAIIHRQLVVNFDGTEIGFEFVWKSFCEKVNRLDLQDQYQKLSFDILLDNSLNTRKGRYLMLIGENESVIDYVERYIVRHRKKESADVRTIVGSSFPGDLLLGNTYAEQYNYRVLMDIILYAERNTILIMRQMGHLYDNLYDLFNQNFSVAGRRKFCRIFLGALYHPQCFVHEEFYCVVLINKQDVDKCDPPLLNRFEKHVIDWHSLVQPRHWSMTSALLSWIDTLIPTNLGKYFPLRQHLFVTYSHDYLCTLIIEAFDCLHINVDNDETEIENSKVLNFCKKTLLRTSTFDLPIILALNSTNNDIIDQYYNLREHFSFNQLIEEAFKNNTLNNRIIYTYTQLYHEIKLPCSDVEEVKLGNLKTEHELISYVKNHYKSEHFSTRLLLIRVDYHGEHQHILSLKHVLFNEHVIRSNRGIWIIFHLQRNMLNQVTNNVLFDNWPVDMIDDLNSHEYIPRKLLQNPSYLELISHSLFSLSDCLFDELVDRCLTKFRYSTFYTDDEKRINFRRNQIMNILIKQYDNTIDENNLHLRSIVQHNLIEIIQTISIPNKTRFIDWRLDLLTNAATIAASRSTLDAIQATIALFYDTYFLLLLGHLEKYSFIDSYIFLINNINIEYRINLNQLWMKCLIKTLETIDTSVMNLDTIPIDLVFDLRLPCAAAEYEIIKQIREKIGDNHQNNFDDEFEERERRAIRQLRAKSIYGTDFIDYIFENQSLFNHYYHDQIAMHLRDTNIQLSTDFVFTLFIDNNKKPIDQVKSLLTDNVETTIILRLFEIGTQLVKQNDLIDILKCQIIEFNNLTIEKRPYYTLIWKNDNLYQIPPYETSIDDELVFECKGNPLIETSLMNLIELLLSSTIIQEVTNIEQLTINFSLIVRGIRDLPSYEILNLEKLRCFLSLIRCLTTLIPEKALTILQHECIKGFNGKFSSSQSIHDFIINLSNTIRKENSLENESLIHHTLDKLEMGFFKDWMVENSDSYDDILKLLDESRNNLWHYSAKNLTYIDRKLNLFSTIKTTNGQLPIDDKYMKLDDIFRQSTNSTRKTEHLFANRFHLNLMMDVTGDQIEIMLTKHFIHFKENFQEIQYVSSENPARHIALLSWIKYYCQMYAFALNNDSRENIIGEINDFLSTNESPFCSTIKLFITKQLLQLSNLTLRQLRQRFINRNVHWIKSILEPSQDTHQNLNLPTLLFESKDEFERVSKILSQTTDQNELRRLIQECVNRPETTYSFFLYFIHYYSCFYTFNTPIDNHWKDLFENELSTDLIKVFEPIGQQLLISLCSNFTVNSYFRLLPQLSIANIHCRLLALNIIVLFLSFKMNQQISLLGSLLFDRNRKMPTNYSQHLKKSCLPGLITSDRIVKQMIDVRTQVQDRLNRGLIYKSGKFIFQCSRDCLWTFYFENCGVPNDRRNCPLCEKPIGAVRYGILIEREPPQIRRSIEDGFQFINKYIIESNKMNRFGYHNLEAAELSAVDEKPDHLILPITFRFIHLLTHTILLFLSDREYLSDNDLNIQNCKQHFRNHIEKDIELLSRHLPNPDDCYIWMYKLLNHFINATFFVDGILDNNEKIIQIEQVIEQKLILTHLESVTDEINQYKVAYAEFVRECDTTPLLQDFVNELCKNEEFYPNLSFFNVTKFHTTDPLNEFIVKMGSLPHGDRMYPMTKFILKRLDDYTNIRYLYPIVIFSNYLIEKFNHRIRRIDAACMKLSYYLENDNDHIMLKQLYEHFLHAWYSLTIKEFRFNCITLKLERIENRLNFAKETSIAALLLNTSRDESSLLLAACMKTIAELQNELVNYFHNAVAHSGTLENRKHVNLQAIHPEHVFWLDRCDLSQKLIDDSAVINYEYGKSKDMIYDYEEVEIYLRDMVSRLPLIDTEKFHFLNYQFELYSENTSLINDVRARVKQVRLIDTERIHLFNLISRMNHDDILHYLGSLDYIFTYLRNCVMDENNDHYGPTMSIQNFVELYIPSHTCLKDNILRKPPFSTVQLCYLIDLYEMLEEFAFDRILRQYLNKNLCPEAFTSEERLRVINQFGRATYEKETIATTLSSIDCWIGMLRRLMVRVLNANVALDVPLQLYLERTDLWSDRVSEIDLQTFEVDETIELQHTLVILCDLEAKQKQHSSATSSLLTNSTIDIQNVESQRVTAETWLRNGMSRQALATGTRVIGARPNTMKGKLRVD
ncbi:unnamed protein product [Rotaria sordida]|uniref:Uncharacterized protein n=2 Tax=Rotaria sordida TaxID=392033 RepID=A0A814NMU6_9BILA|nr:unnamed protein product [Rotaria sordida]